MVKLKNIKNKVLIFLIGLVIVLTFNAKYVSLINQFEREVQSKVIQLDRYAELCSTFIAMMSIYGNDFFLQDTSVDSELFDFLEYDSRLDTYNLDAVGGTEYQKTMSNITGLGSIPLSGTKRDELNLAFQYNRAFDNVVNRIPDIAWLCYTSESGFVSIYPWIASQDFAYTEELKRGEYYTSVNPQNNPQRNYHWTQVYLDYAGKGLVVSLSGPIYNEDTFVGVVSLDLTNQQLSNIMSSEYEGYLIDSGDSVIAASHNVEFGEAVIAINTLLDRSTYTMEKTNNEKQSVAKRVGAYYVYTTAVENAPWKLVFRTPIAKILMQTTIYTLPVLLIGILFLLSIYEVNARNKTEVLLNNSINELKSYEEMLENAAKFDFLTSSYNRRGFRDRFEESIDTNSLIENPIAFILGDIDFFKKLNDTYGHNAGDKVLIQISDLMKNIISERDVLCRWGGEEFLIMLYDKTYEEALLVAEQIREEIEAAIIIWEDLTKIKITMTLGVVDYDYKKSVESTVSKADEALYYGKNHGRNRVVGYHEMNQ